MALRGVPEVLFSSFACFSFLAAGGKERELGSLLKALGKARRQQLWQREIWGKKKKKKKTEEKKKSRVGEGTLGGVDETGAEGVVVCMCMKREGAERGGSKI